MKKIIVIVIAAVAVLGAVAAYIFLIPRPPEEIKKSVYVPGEFFITNVKNSKTLLKTTIVLEVNRAADDKEFQTFLTEHNHVIRDAIVFILRDKTDDELRSPGVKQMLTREIVSAVNERLGIDNVQTIYFNDFVLQ